LFTTAGRFSLGIYLLHPVCLLLKPLYYDELAKESRGLSAPTTLEMGVVTFFCVYFVGFLFFYLVENPSVKCGDYLVARFKQYYRGRQPQLTHLNKQSQI
jgi:peptidoglycan/LPS O-acetylase OafA/YrhL